jgi:hypothetical protein
MEAKKQKLDLLKQTDAEKASAVQEKETWNSILKRSEGEKVKDDIGLLKKSIKRKA